MTLPAVSAAGDRSRDRSWIVIVLSIVAAANLAAGIWLSLQPARAIDLQRVAAWAGEWGRGFNVYGFDGEPGVEVDYPPWALVALWPLSLIAPAWRPAIWIVVNLGLLTMVVRRLVDRVSEPARARRLLMLLLAATACARTLNQFSLLAYTLGLAGAFATSAPSTMFGGVLLGLSLMKPQIGGAIWVWTLLRRKWKTSAVALVVPAVLTFVFAARVHIAAFDIAARYLHVLAQIYGTSDPLMGSTQLRPWVMAIWPWPADGLVFTVVLSAVLLLPALATLQRGWPWNQRELDVLAFTGAISLLVTRHLSYDFLLLWPAIVAWRAAPLSARARSERGVGLCFVALALLLVLDLPAWTRLALLHGAPTGLAVLVETDRVVAAGAWVALSWRLIWSRPPV